MLNIFFQVLHQNPLRSRKNTPSEGNRHFACQFLSVKSLFWSSVLLMKNSHYDYQCPLTSQDTDIELIANIDELRDVDIDVAFENINIIDETVRCNVCHSSRTRSFC